MQTRVPFVLAALASALFFAGAHAEDQTISVPGEGWRIRFTAPRLTPIESREPSLYSGMAGRLRLSFLVETPRCAGPDSNENIYNCFAAVLEKDAAVVSHTEHSNVARNGVHVTYLSEREPEYGTGRALNVNVLFARHGKWANVHVSMNAPQKEDVNAVFDVVNSIVAEDEPDQVPTDMQ
ncbi:MAG: hypothetical protein JO002_05390 [Burkholderiaceae bacterium]|nr:hypothetical protein [Burkholderiaceae bacterium]